jgi:PAS domain S-box-containing protein
LWTPRGGGFINKVLILGTFEIAHLNGRGMPSASYIDIAALDAVRTRFAAGDAMAVLTPALDRVIWANGAGATLFGYSDVGAIVGAEPQIGLAARRQIMATSGYPGIGRDRAITVRLASGLTSRAVTFAASEIALPDGERAILLAHAAAAASWRSPTEGGARAITGLDLPGQPVAILDAEGGVVAASRDFAELDLKPETLVSLVAEAAGERLARRPVDTGDGTRRAALLRLTDNPATHLLAVTDDALPDSTDRTAEPDAGEAAVAAGAVEAAAAEDPQPDDKQRPAEATATEQSEDLPVAAVDRQQFGVEARPSASESDPAAAETPEEAQPEQAQPVAAGPQTPLEVAAEPVETTTRSEPADGSMDTHAAEDEAARVVETASASETQNGEPSVEDPAGEGAPTLEVVPPSAGAAADPEPATEAGQPVSLAATDPVAAIGDGTSPEAEHSELAAASEAEREAAEAAAISASETAAAAASVADEEASADTPAETIAEAKQSGSGVRAPEAVADDEVREGIAASLPHIDRSAAPVTFVWKTDAAGRFSEIGEEFVKAVGKQAADVIGVSFRDAAAMLGIDPGGEIAGLLERHDTWSGRAVFWPVAGTDLRIPVDLAALPTYDRDRRFGGFRGFGVARAGDAVVDPDATGIALADGTVDLPSAANSEPPEHTPGEPDGSTPDADPHRGEPPILTIVPKPERRAADKVIRLAEHRQPTIDKNLSPGERNAFREIGDRLRKESGAPAVKGPSEPTRRADNDESRPAARASGGGKGKEGESEEPRPEALLDAEPAQAATDGTVEATGASEDAAETADQIAEPEGIERPTVGDMVDAPEAIAQASSETIEPATDEQAAGEPVGEDEPRSAEQRHGDETSSVEPLTAAEDGRETSGALSEAEDVSIADEGHVQSDAPANESTTVGAEVSSAVIDIRRSAAASEVEPLAAQDYVPSAFALGSPAGRRAPIDTSILDKLPVPVLMHSGDALHYANREFLEFTGYDDVEELQAAGGLDVLFGEPYPAEDDEAEPGRKLRLRTREGLEYPVEALLQSVPWGEGKALLLSLRRRWGQPVSYPAQQAGPVPDEALEIESRIEEMRAIVDTATDGVVLIEPDGTIRSISSPAEALFGFDSDQVAGKPFSSLFAIESQRAAREYLNGLSDNGVASVLNDGREVIGREAQGRFIPLFMTIGKLPNDSGFCAVVRDITQWKRAEEELTQARAQAERASSQKTDFLARVSHEIRTPLNAIIGFSELMLDEKFGPISNDRYRDYLRDINRSGNHVLDLVNDLLDISKIEAGQQEMSYEAVSLNDTLAETVAMIQPSANRERVIIRSSFASRLPEVVADLRSIRQIALNLLSNAIRYTPAGGQVIVSTAYEASGDVVMRVRDTGIGMTQAEIEQALKPFKQINALKRARGDGTGLGLPLTKAMVEANRARFMINSTPGEGTLVEISFPSTRVLAD